MNGIVIYIVIFFLLFSILNYKYLKEKMEKELNSKRQELLDVDNFFYTSKYFFTYCTTIFNHIHTL